jgi:hypothetical protein
VFDDHSNDQFRLIERRPADKPGMVAKGGRQVLWIDALLEPRHLSGPGLAGHRYGGKATSGASRTVNHGLETCGHDSEMIALDNRLDIFILRPWNQIWCDQTPAVGQQ